MNRSFSPGSDKKIEFSTILCTRGSGPRDSVEPSSGGEIPAEDCLKQEIYYTQNAQQVAAGGFSSVRLLTSQSTAPRTKLCVRSESDLVMLLLQYIYWSVRAQPSGNFQYFHLLKKKTPWP
jgi:hypothetical protein